jgi:hypothetical protein
MSAKVIQKQEAADQYREWDPEVDVGGDYCEERAGAGTCCLEL